MTRAAAQAFRIDFDPVLTAACVLLITVSLAWVVVARLIARNLTRRPVEPVGPLAPRDVWKAPPES